MTELTVAAYTGSVDLFGKSVTDLQTGVAVNGTAVTGTLKYVDDYTGFSGTVSEQSGNYLVLQATVEEGTTVTAQVIGGDHGPSTLDSDGIIILRIRNTTQTVQFVASSDGADTNTQTFTLSGLTLEEETPGG